MLRLGGLCGGVLASGIDARGETCEEEQQNRFFHFFHGFTHLLPLWQTHGVSTDLEE